MTGTVERQSRTGGDGGRAFVEEPRSAGKREVDLYVRTYGTLLQTTGAIGVSSLEEAHINAASSLHAGAREAAPDMNAFIYSVQRLPACVPHAKEIVLGQSEQAFHRAGYHDLSAWETVSAPGRRRRWLYDRKATLAAYIASASDLDDLVPTIVAYQIEWNKMYALALKDRTLAEEIATAAAAETPAADLAEDIGERLLLSPADWDRLRRAWGSRTWENLLLVISGKKRYSLQLLGGSYLGYARVTRQWWTPASRHLHEADLNGRPIYFVSSNTHSVINVLTGTARRRREALTRYIREHGEPELRDELTALEEGRSRSSWENLLYFSARPFFAAPGREADRRQREAEERALGIVHIEPTGAVDVGIQIFELARLDPAWFDPRLCGPDGAPLDPRGSDAVVVNVNYPLGLAAYHIMTQVASSIDQLAGVYVLGKAATLNGRIGDVMIANVVYDEHSGNTYWFDNCFSYGDLDPYLVYGAALDNQKAVTVKGTYLQNEGYLDFFYRENFTVVEMEAGPYLNALYEDMFLHRYPDDEAVNLRPLTPERMDLGIIHYASDTPYTRSQTLGARGLSYYGMDSTYASTIAILRRILTREAERTRRDAPAAAFARDGRGHH